MIRSLPVATVACPSCLTEFPVDPAKVPSEGVHAICSSCRRVFRVEPSGLDIPEAEPVRMDTGDDDTHEALVAPEASTAQPTEVSTAQPTEAPAEPESEDHEPTPPASSAEPEDGFEPREMPFEDLRSLASEAMAEPDDEDDEGGFQVETSTLSQGKERFGQRDPHDRARRLARVLVSDIIAYYPIRYHESFSQGTVKQDFEDEVKKSWKEYVDQVGEELAESTPYFDEALNEILGKGEEIF